MTDGVHGEVVGFPMDFDGRPYSCWRIKYADVDEVWAHTEKEALDAIRHRGLIDYKTEILSIEKIEYALVKEETEQ